MYAVIKTGGKQYKVAANDIITVERLAGEPGDTVELSEVLMVAGDGAPVVGAPRVEGAIVAAEVVEQKRDRKIVIFKKRRRQNSRRKNGHRQHLTTLRINEILTDGKAPSKASRKSASKKAEAELKTPEADATTGNGEPAGVAGKKASRSAAKSAAKTKSAAAGTAKAKTSAKAGKATKAGTEEQ